MIVIRPWKVVLGSAVVGAIALGYWYLAIPTHRVAIESELIMLGDLDGDRRWTRRDLDVAEHALEGPMSLSDDLAWRLDINQNGLFDVEDIAILRALVSASGDPYAAETAARLKGTAFPRPRELYRYVSVTEYRTRPVWAVPYPSPADASLAWLGGTPLPAGYGSYAEALELAIHAESARFEDAWRKRQPFLLPAERDYATLKMNRLGRLADAGERFELLLALIDAVEDAETLTMRGQPEFPLKLLVLRDHLREVLVSPLYASFARGEADPRLVLRRISDLIHEDLGLDYVIETMAPPRNLADLEGYLQRSEWQYHKSTTTKDDFLSLIAYAQHDARYLRAVSRTSRRMHDVGVENHNLPMVLLFREALRIKKGDKKKAVALLDEAIRIPYAWIKSIPRDVLPSSLALDNFLLPGNMEDGADKSRHWNVFGGIALYKSPQEAFEISLRREMQDIREGGFAESAMREFLRDMIANINGIYHVMTVNPDLLAMPPHGGERASNSVD